MNEEERYRRIVAWKERRDPFARALEIGPPMFLTILLGAAIYAAWNLAQSAF